MASRVEIDLSSYDQLFPSQDVMPKGSFGNLIALPLQGGCRERGTTLFSDPTSLEPYDDQWAFLSAVPFHDYLDPGPVFSKMHSKRVATYTTLGFDIPARR